MKNTPLPSFASPPVHEVAFAVRFADLGLKAVHLGQFYDTVKDEFPTTDDLPPYVDESDFGVQLIQLPQLRRVRMTSANKQNSLQIQGNRLIFSWVKSTQAAPYPRYRSVYNSFKMHWVEFNKFLKETVGADVSPTAFELTYINELKQSPVSMLASIEQAIHVFRWNEIKRETLGEPSNLNFALHFDLPEGAGKAVVSVNPAKKSTGEEVLLFILKCAGPAAKKSDEWFEIAHEWIVRGFEELTSPQAQSDWGREA